MARHTDSFNVDKRFEDAWRHVQGALMYHNWRIVSVRDTTLFVRERMSLETMLWRNPCRFAVQVWRLDDSRSRIDLIGSTLGFGPLPRSRLKRVTETLRSQILAAFAEPEPDPAPAPAKSPAAAPPDQPT